MIKFSLTFLTILFLATEVYCQKRMDITTSFIFQRSFSINHYGTGLSVDYDRLKDQKRFSVNAGFSIYYLKGRKDYPVDSSFWPPTPNGTPNRFYYINSRISEFAIPITLNYQVKKNEISELNASIGLMPTFTINNERSGMYYIRPWFKDSIFRPGPYFGKYNLYENHSIIVPTSIPIVVYFEYLRTISDLVQINYRFSLAKFRFGKNEDDLFISFGMGIRLNRKIYSR